MGRHRIQRLVARPRSVSSQLSRNPVSCTWTPAPSWFSFGHLPGTTWYSAHPGQRSQIIPTAIATVFGILDRHYAGWGCHHLVLGSLRLILVSDLELVGRNGRVCSQRPQRQRAPPTLDRELLTGWAGHLVRQWCEIRREPGKNWLLDGQICLQLPILIETNRTTCPSDAALAEANS
jgi:hypothetical protein